MAYEIYYTSAPQGLKRGAQGFCTVAATEGIPPALLQRLEALSGYRHHFGPGDTTGGINPPTYAHWTLTLAGKTYHVLSRIADAGFDYTHRTNSLAHHIALEGSELAAAGPAAMLAQPGLMIERWDGQVGPIHRAIPLPQHDGQAARCSTWEQLTGDAGWGGVLADAFSKSASKPVCIVYTPGQDILTLIGESVRLLGPAQRWQATFNTYFTSMPTSVVCAWRCCLAGTPAAQAAIRYATGGIIINLADPHRLGDPPDSAWATAARTGISAAAKAPSRTDAAKPSSPTRQPPIIAGPAPEPVDEDAKLLQDLAAVHRHAAPEAPRKFIPVPLKLPAQEKPVPRDIDLLARRNRRQMLLLYSAAVLAIGVAIVVLVHANRPPELPPPPPTTRTVFVPQPVPETEPAVVIPAPVETQPVVQTPATVPHQPEVAPVIVTHTPQPVVVAPEPIMVLRGTLERPTSGSGLRDKAQTFDLLPAEAQKLRLVGGLGIAFPRGGGHYLYNHGDLHGAFSIRAFRSADPSFAILWKDHGSGGSGHELLTVALDKLHGQINLTWKSSLVLRRPDVGALAYWIVQHSLLQAGAVGKPAEYRLEFSPPVIAPIDLLEPTSALQLPADLPPDCTLTSHPGQLPAGWQVTTVPNPDIKDTTSHSLVLTKHTRVNVLDATFHMKFSGGWTALECDFADQVKKGQVSLEGFQKDLAEVDDQITHLNDDANHELTSLDKQLAEKVALQNKTDAELRDINYTRDGVNRLVDDLHRQIAARRGKLDADKAPLTSKHTDFDQLCQGFKDAQGAFAELKAFELTITLPDGMAVGTLQFEHK